MSMPSSPHQPHASSPQAQRDLLFGLIALQVGLIDQAKLVAAFQAWTLDKSRPLAEHLIGLGHLDAERKTAISAMVDLHLKMHGDVEKSLAALAVGDSTREKLAALGDPDVEATISQVGSGSSSESDRTATYHVGTSTSDGQRFRVLRPHAQGGLGAVFVALDGELNREVALKQILENRADDPHSRQRFVLEAEITGGLEHPGIVPVYGLGAYQDGRPYYAMRFIRGDSLKDAIAKYHSGPPNVVAFRQLLRRFLDVCNAIEYAHSRGVLHRDLKPGNIIVGKYGETLVVDWGLAKALGKSEPTAEERTLMPSSTSGSAETLPGQAIGTPAYMSPEQARGDLDALGPRADVYSLGATLYGLLTGNPPFEGSDLGSILQRVEKGEYAPPRSLDGSIDKALEAICLKAMALKPEDRYPSCRALAEDIECWLADEPVTARREPVRERLARWVRKHPVAVSTAAAALVVGLAATLYGFQREREFSTDLTKANATLDAERKRAEARERQAIDAVRRFRDVVSEDPTLKNSAELEDLRNRLLKEPLAFFRTLREQLQADRDTRPEALSRLANAAFELGRLTDEISDKPDALTAMRESLAIRQKLAADHPTITNYQSDLAVSHHTLGLLLRKTGQSEAARTSHEAARRIFQKLADDHPSVIEYQRNLAAHHNDIGKLLHETGDRAGARGTYEAALAIFQKLASDHPSVPEYQTSLANSLHNLGTVIVEIGQVDAARRAYETVLAIQKKLAGDHPNVAKYQRDLAASHGDLGDLLRVSGQPDAAREAYETARAIFQKLVDDHPSVTQYQRDLATTHQSVGLLLSEAGDPAGARAAHEAALAIKKKLASDHPSVPEYQSVLARNHLNLGNLLRDTGQLDAARANFESALAIYDRLARDHPAVPRYQRDLAASHGDLGILLRASGQPDAAREAYETARAIFQKLAADHPSVTQYQRDLAIGHHNLGRLLGSIGQPDAARQAFEDALAIRRKLAADYPKSPEYASHLGSTLNSRAMVDLDDNQFREARDRLREAVDWQKKALATNPRYPTYRQSLTDCYSNLRKAAQGLDDADLIAEADSGLAELEASDPRLQALNARLAAVAKGEAPKDNAERLALAQRAYDTKRHATAARLWAEALETDPKLAADRQQQVPYNAACAAALAAAGDWNDEPPVDDAAKVELRTQALGWLQGELAAWSKFVDNPQARPVIVQTLDHWKKDSDLASVRDTIDKLPEEERADWRALWEEVVALREKAAAP